MKNILTDSEIIDKVVNVKYSIQIKDIDDFLKS